MRSLLLICAALVACDEGRAQPPGNGPGPSVRRDAAIRDVVTSTPALDASIDPLDGATEDANDAAAAPDATAAPDAATASPDARAPTFDASGFADAGPPSADIQLTTTCSADFGGEPVVSFNGSIAVGSLRSFTLAASLQLDLQGQTGLINLSTRHRIDSGLVVNLVTHSTWTNISQDSQVITGMRPDTIGGTLNVRSYQGAQGIMDVELQNVRLQNASDLSFCTINGRVRTFRLGR